MGIVQVLGNVWEFFVVVVAQIWKTFAYETDISSLTLCFYEI